MKRGNGEGTVYFDKTKNRWIAKVTVGYTADGKAARLERRKKQSARRANCSKHTGHRLHWMPIG